MTFFKLDFCFLEEIGLKTLSLIQSVIYNKQILWPKIIFSFNFFFFDWNLLFNPLKIFLKQTSYFISYEFPGNLIIPVIWDTLNCHVSLKKYAWKVFSADFPCKHHQSFWISFSHLSPLFLFPSRSPFTLKGFLIIPKKVEQNQTKIFDRDKATSVGNFTVPNSISDSNKNLNSFKTIKNTITSDGVTLSNATNNNSSNQLVGSNETELITFFSTTNFTNITSQVGSIVEVPCTVHHLGEGTVSVTARI